MKRASPQQLIHPHESYREGFRVAERSLFKTRAGLSESVVSEISAHKDESDSMRRFRLRAYRIFREKTLPAWASALSNASFEDIYYYLAPTEKPERSWETLPTEIKTTFDRLGIPQAEQKYLAGVGAQYESEVVYHNLDAYLAKKGVLFMGTDTALRTHPALFWKYFGTIVPPEDNKYAALNSAVWSGGSFLYVPKGVTIDLPLQAYFRINAERMGQFERTLIIAEEGSSVQYVEGCTAPTYTTNSLHSAVVEIVVKAGARVRYTTIQNWSKNVYNLVTKRAVAHRDARMEWVDCNLGSRLTMKYPSVYLVEPGARAEILSLAFAGRDQHQDSGGKVIHAAGDTSSRIISKSICKAGGRTSYRGLLKVNPGAERVKSHVTCDALILDERSRSDTYPLMDIRESRASIEHEATVSRISAEQLFYLMSRGVSEAEARGLIVNGFFESIARELPMEYAVELNRLINIEMDGSVG